jgi:predicted TIM-barrel fold metal-dependent hydrolase
METFLSALDEAGIERAVVLPIDCTTAHGCRIFSNELIAEIVEKYPRLIGFASVDPNLRDAPKTLERAVREYGLRGLKLDPALQLFDIDDPETAFPVYSQCVQLGIPVLMHCGLSWAPQGRSSRAQPLQLETVVHEFPDLRVVIAHCGWPWVNDALLLALKYPNVYLDTAVIYSGTPADSLRRVLADVIGLDVVQRSLHDKLLLGSNTPRIRPKRMTAAVRALGLDPAVERKITHDNAVALLGLKGARA